MQTGFTNGANTTNEYTYDHNGNLTKDLNKNISNIQYNSLNLPSVVTFGNGNTITYLYAADGRKLRTVHVTNGTATTTDYCGNVIYENGTQKLLLTEEGYVDLVNSNTYYYYLKDHQGNNRVVISSSGTVMETNHYYPFGGVFSTSSSVQPYKYNGKELDTKNSLNWYDYGARHYDAALGRWFAADPLSEKYYADSPYIYCGSNPVNRIDLFGMDYWSTSNPDEISRFWSWMSQSDGNGIGSYSFITDSWNRMTDKVFLEAYGKYGQQALTYNDQTYKLYSSYVTYENGEIVVNGVSTTALGLLSNKAFGLEDAYSLGMTTGGIFAGAKELSYVSGGSWKGKNGKWNNLSWGGNQYTGARRIAVSKANLYKGIGRGLFVIDTFKNINDMIKTHELTIPSMNIAINAISTFGGIPGMFIGGVYYYIMTFDSRPVYPLKVNKTIAPRDNTFVAPH